MADMPHRPITPTEIPFEHKPGSEPVVENPNLPVMDPVQELERAVPEGRGDRMPAKPAPDKGSDGRMEPVGELLHLADAAGGHPGAWLSSGPADHPDQERRPLKPETQATEGYVRLTVRAEAESLTVVGAGEVEGPLVTSDVIGAGLVYEVTADGKRIGIEWLPDAASSRSFVNIDRPEAALGHHFTTPESFQFTVRVPRAALHATDLAHLDVALHRLTEPPAQPLGPEPLRAQLGESVSEVAALHGIALEGLEPPVRTELERILHRRTP